MRIRTRERMVPCSTLTHVVAEARRGERGAIDLIAGLEAVPTTAEIHH